jgi:hemoglobin
MTVTARIAFLALLLAGCQALQPSAGPSPTLYQRLGGQTGVANLVDTFLLGILRDPVVGPTFADSSLLDLPRLKYSFEQQICEVADGPCRYTGPDMRTAHKGRNVTAAQFDAMGAVMQQSLADRGVDPAAANELLARLGAMRGDIVGL